MDPVPISRGALPSRPAVHNVALAPGGSTSQTIAVPSGEKSAVQTFSVARNLHGLPSGALGAISRSALSGFTSKPSADLQNSAFSSAGSPSATGDSAAGHGQVRSRAVGSRQIRNVLPGAPGSTDLQVVVGSNLPSYR